MNVSKLLVASVMMAGMAGSGAAMAAGDAEAGEARSAVCASCHGKDGIAQVPGYPNLAGQDEAYLVSALKAYKSKERNGGQATVMQGQAGMLSDEDIVNLAAYYASLPAGGGE